MGEARASKALEMNSGNPDARSIIADLDLWLTREGTPLLRWTVAVSLPDRADGTAHGLSYMINAETREVYEVTGY